MKEMDVRLVEKIRSNHLPGLMWLGLEMDTQGTAPFLDHTLMAFWIGFFIRLNIAKITNLLVSFSHITMIC